MPPPTFSAAILPAPATKYGSRKPGKPERPGVDAEHDEPFVAVAFPRLLEDRRLVLARQAPRGEEVDHERLAAVRRESDLTVSRQPVERELGRRLADARGLLLALQHLPAEQPEHRSDERDRGDLTDELGAAGH